MQNEIRLLYSMVFLGDLTYICHYCNYNNLRIFKINLDGFEISFRSGSLAEFMLKKKNTKTLHLFGKKCSP